MVAIPFPLNSSPGLLPEQGGGRIVNMFVVKNDDGAATKVSWRRSAGLVLKATVEVPDFIPRGFLHIPLAGVPEQLLYVCGGHLLAIDPGFGVASFGAVTPGVGPVTIARNNKYPNPDIMIVTDGGDIWYCDLAAPVVAFSDPSLNSPTSVSNHRGYFLFTHSSGVLQSSDLNDIAFNALAFVTAPGPLYRGVSFGDDFIAFSDRFFEIYRDVGGSPFPLQFQGRVNRGLINTNAIAGWEDGGTNKLLWVADNNTVVQYQGAAQPAPISTDDVSRAIELAIASNAQSLIQAFIYAVDGNLFWVMTCPGLWTWEYNTRTGLWSERISSGMAGGWRGAQGSLLGNQYFVGDYLSGNLLAPASGIYDEDGTPMEVLLESGIAADFPKRIRFYRADFDIISNSTGTATVNVSWSDDGGRTYSNEVSRSFMPTGGRDQVTVLRTGSTQARGRRFRLTCDSDAEFIMMGGDFDAEERGAA